MPRVSRVEPSTALLLLVLAGPAAAVDGEPVPVPGPTSTTCQGGLVWNPDRRVCEAPERSSLGEDALYEAARELAWADRPSEALRVLDAMAGQSDSRVLTYRGFVLRRAGDWGAARRAYEAALAADPDNLLARSYFGMGLVEGGDLTAARAQLAEIRARGGSGGWPDAALAEAIRDGTAARY